VLPIAGDEVSRSNGFHGSHPTRADPAIILMPDRSSFCCWVEPLADGGRWMFLDRDGMTYVGPAYQREASLEEIEAVLSRWRASRDLVEHAREGAT
jgi:hypothetical protein